MENAITIENSLNRERQLTIQASELPNIPEGSISPRSVSSLSAILLNDRNDIIITESETSAVTSSQNSQNTQNAPNRGWSYRYPTCQNDARGCKGFIKTAIYPGGSLADIAEITNAEESLLCIWICSLIHSRVVSLVAGALFLAGCYMFSLAFCFSQLTVSWLTRWFHMFLMRCKIRTHFDIEGSKCEDCALSLCCEKFVIHQALEELKYRQTQTGYSHFNIPMIHRNRSQIMRT